MNNEDQQRDMLICSLSARGSELGITTYDSQTGIIAVTTLSIANCEKPLSSLVESYEFTHFLIPLTFPDELHDFLSNNCTDKLVILKNSEFSFQGGLEAMRSVMYKSLQEIESSNSLLSGVLDLSSPTIVGSIGAIINYYKKRLGKNESGLREFSIISFTALNLPHGLYLSSEAYDDLQIFHSERNPSIFNDYHAKEGLSLFGLFNRCATPMGKTTLRKWFQFPCDDMSSINLRLNMIEYLIQKQNHPIVNEILKSIKALPEIRHILLNLRQGTMKLPFWIKLYRSLIKVSELCDFFQNHQLFMEYEQFSLFNQNTYEKFQLIIREIEFTIELNGKPNEIHAKSECDSKLRDLRNEYSKLDMTLTNTAKQILKTISKDSLIHSLRVTYIPEMGFLIVIPRTKQLDANDFPPTFELKFSTEEYFFCKNPMVISLDDTIGDIYSDITARELQIFLKLSEQILDNSILVTQVWESIGILDAICSLSIATVDLNLVRPQFITSRQLHVKKGRHPILEKCTEVFVPNTTELYNEEPPIHIIIGPNSSGKSVYMKQVALIVFLANIGSFVPAEMAIIPLVDQIFTVFHMPSNTTDPLASSFTTELLRISEIISKSTCNSLVLIDEFAKTTNYENGSSLLCGFIQFMANKGTDCPMIFLTTHYRSILDPVYLDPSLYTLCTMEVRIEEDDQILLFLYHLIKNGVTDNGQSFGLQCAMRAGLQDNLIERASVVSDCIEKGIPVPPNSRCFDEAFENRMKNALSRFFQWKGTGNPRAFLYGLKKIVNGED